MELLPVIGETLAQTTARLGQLFSQVNTVTFVVVGASNDSRAPSLANEADNQKATSVPVGLTGVAVWLQGQFEALSDPSLQAVLNPEVAGMVGFTIGVLQKLAHSISPAEYDGNNTALIVTAAYIDGVTQQ